MVAFNLTAGNEVANPGENPISVEAPTEPVQPINTTPTDTVSTLDPIASANRANKLKLGVPSFPSSFEEVRSQIASGNEDMVRRAAAAHQDHIKWMQQQQALLNAATSKGGVLNPIEEQTIQELVKRKQTNPDLVIEKGYADQVFNEFLKAAQDNPDSFLHNAFQENPGQVSKDVQQAIDFKTQQELVGTQYENAQSDYKNQGWFGWSIDQLKSGIPFYWELMLRGVQGDTSRFHGLLGTNLDEQATNLFRITDPEKFVTALKTMDESLKGNPTARMAFWSAMVGQSHNEHLFNNMMSAIGLGADVTTIGMSKLIRGAVTSTLMHATNPASKAAMLDAAGNVKAAGVENFGQLVVKDMAGKPDAIKFAQDSLPSMFTADLIGVKSDTRSVSQELVNRLYSGYKANKDKFIELVKNAVNVERTPALQAVKENAEYIAAHETNKYPGIENAVSDVELVPDKENNLKYLRTTFLKNGTDVWGKDSQAKAFIKENQFPNKELLVNAEVKPHGVGFKVEITRPFDETDPTYQRLLIPTAAYRTPESLLNGYRDGLIGKIRTSEDTLSPENVMNRKAAAVGPNNFFNLVKDSQQNINKLRRWSFGIKGYGNTAYERWNQWKQVMSVADGMKNEEGRFAGFHTPGEVIDLYQHVLNRTPDEMELAAAFDYKFHRDMIDTLNTMREFRRLTRQGGETHTFKIPYTQTDRSTTFKQVTAYGAMNDGLPKGNHAVVFIGDSPDDVKIFNAAHPRLSKATQEQIDKGIGDGTYKVVRILNAHEYPFDRSFGPKVDPGLNLSKIEYAVTKSTKSEPINWHTLKVGQVPDKDYAHYVVQPITRKDPITGVVHYLGDRTIMGHDIKTITSDYATKLENIRQLLSDGKDAEAKAFYDNSGLQQEWSEVSDWFSDRFMPPSRLDKNGERIRTVTNDKRSIDMDRELKDKYKGEVFRDSDMDNHGKPDFYNVFTVNNTGTRANPLYSIAPTKFVDPSITVARNMMKAVDGLWMDDYKASSMYHWIQEAKPYLNANENAVESNPMYYFYADDKSKWLPGADAQRVAELKVSNLHIRQFLGIKDQTQQSLQWLEQKMADAIYNTDSKVKKAVLYTIDALPSITKDPIGVLRSMAMNYKLGMFSPAQVLAQAQTFANVVGIAGPKHAASAVQATLFHAWGSFNGSDSFIQTLDRLSSMSGWKAGEFTEARKLFLDSGFNSVGREHIYRNTQGYGDLIGDRFHKFLNLGQTFFQWGEQFNRSAAWYAAYKEFRDVHPTGSADVRWILNRADFLSTNMTRASASSVNQGLLSLTSTFTSYQIRLTEQVLGKRLTWPERSRLIATYGILYGVPGAFGLSGLPIGDYINKWAIENGYVRDNSSYFKNFAMEGGIAQALHAATGNWYNVQQRYGVSGLEQFKDLIEDKDFWSLATGAPGSIVAQTIANSSGLFRAVYDITFGNGQFKPKIEDYIRPFQSMASVSAAVKLYYGLTIGQQFNQNMMYMGDTSKSNAIFQFLSGLSPTEYQTYYNQNWSEETRQQAIKKAQTEAIREYRLGYLSVNQATPDYSNANDHFRNARAYMTGIPRDKWGETWAIAHQAVPAPVKKNWDYYRKHVPDAEADINREALIRYLESRRK